MHVGKMPKWSSWVTNEPELEVLRSRRDGGHSHLPWGVAKAGRSWTFATQEEAEYPALLCQRAAAAVTRAANAKGMVLAEPKTARDESTVADENNAKRRAEGGRQPR